MSGADESRCPPRQIDEAAKARFLAALRGGARREDAAAEAGFSLTGFYGTRRRDPAFAADWQEALRRAPAAERRARAYAERGEVRIAPANRRLLQRRRRRHVRFTAERQALFLAHFLETCDTRASAAAAGVSESTVNLHRRNDWAFAAAFDDALPLAYENLEVEIVRQRLEAQVRLRAAIEVAGPARRPAACPHCGQIPDTGEEFDRTMRLLARFDRKARRPDGRFSPGGRRQPWTFDRAIALLDRKLRAMGARSTPSRASPKGNNEKG